MAISPILIVVVAFPIVAVGIWLINYGLPTLWHAILTHHTLRNPVHLGKAPAGSLLGPVMTLVLAVYTIALGRALVPETGR